MKYLTATETGDGWLVEITESKIVPTIDYVHNEVRYLNLNDKEVTILPLAK